MAGAAKKRNCAPFSHTEGLNRLTSLLDHKDDALSPVDVVVVGAQSAGKTAVLRALADMELYRSQDIPTATRAPMIITRLQTMAVPGLPSYAFIHKGESTNGAKVFDLADIGKEMEAYTSTATPEGAGAGTTGGGGGASEISPIHLHIVRSSGPTMTIIDLPTGTTGITPNFNRAKPAHGVHTENVSLVKTLNAERATHGVHTDTVSLVKSYLHKKYENMVVLVVIPALAVSVDAELALATTLDPENQRTYGVVTQVGNVQYVLHGWGYASKPPMDAGRVYLYLGFLASFTRRKDQNMTPQALREMEDKFVTSNSAVYVTRENTFWGLPL